MAGEQVSAEQAVNMGFVHAVYADDGFAADNSLERIIGCRRSANSE